MSGTKTQKWTQTAIEDLVLHLLAQQMEEDETELRAKLLEKGAGMPIDSLEMFDMLAEFRKETGLKIPVRKLRRNTLRSVGAFAKFAAREASGS
jgi:acyl carrier protein